MSHLRQRYDGTALPLALVELSSNCSSNCSWTSPVKTNAFKDVLLDIKREPTKKRGKYFLIGGGVLVLGLTTFMLSNLEARAPSVDRATLWIDSVQRGTMVRQVRAPGTLTPEHIRYVVAVTSGRV